MKRVLVPLAPGFEEIEALGVVDILRRAGAEVTVAGTVEGPVEGRCGIRVVPDTTMDEVKGSGFDMVVLPGGALGTENLKKDQRVRDIVEELNEAQKLVAAICAAPVVLSAVGVSKGRLVTSHPTVRGDLTGERVSAERVVVDGNIVTSQGPGTAIEFAFKLVEMLFGPEKVEEVNRGVLARIWNNSNSKEGQDMNIHEEISRIAYELYEKSGRVDGRDKENWHEAERIVKSRRQAPEKTASVAAAPAKAPVAAAPAKAPARGRPKKARV